MLPSTTPSVLPPPLLRLPAELHLTIISFLPKLSDAKDKHDLAILQLRQTNRYFHGLIPAPTHTDLLFLELVLYQDSVYACKFCLRLRPWTKFASAMLKGKTGLNGFSPEKRFCAECGFDATLIRHKERYNPGTRACVNGVDYVWCKQCKQVKQGDEADSVCSGLCKACYTSLGCRCSVSCHSIPKQQKILSPPPHRMLPKENLRRLRSRSGDTESDWSDSPDDEREDMVFDYYDDDY